jgi:hypothetical protein
MIEVSFLIIILALLAFIAYSHREHAKEREKLVNAVIAKTPEQYRDLQLASKVAQIKPEPPMPLDFIPENEMNDEEFQDKVVSPQVS